MKLLKIEDPQIKINIQNLFKILNDDFWTLIGMGNEVEDLEFNLAIQKSKKYKTEITEYINSIQNTSLEGEHIYTGHLSLSAFLDSLDLLYNQIIDWQDQDTSYKNFISSYCYLMQVSNNFLLKTPEGFGWDGASYIFGEKGRINFNSGSMVHKVFKLLVDNPGEWIFIADIRRKHGFSDNNIRRTISTLRKKIGKTKSIKIQAKNSLPGAYMLIFLK